MKELASIRKDNITYKIYEFWFKYYIYLEIDGTEYPGHRFEEYEEALEYVTNC